mgnify:CR=1 FL=1
MVALFVSQGGYCYIHCLADNERMWLFAFRALSPLMLHGRFSIRAWLIASSSRCLKLILRRLNMSTILSGMLRVVLMGRILPPDAISQFRCLRMELWLLLLMAYFSAPQLAVCMDTAPADEGRSGY